MKAWPLERAKDWGDKQPWLVGCNYFPAYAVNPLEMWQRETFRPGAIAGELDLARRLGFNTIRTNLHSFVHRDDAKGLLDRLETFLALAGDRGLSVMLCFFDDCAHSGKQPKPGRQDDPVPGVHNSQWTPSPAHAEVQDRQAWPALERFVREVMDAHARDSRVLCWDLYNEPGNGGLENKSLAFLQEVFLWGREAGAEQPLTVGVWDGRLKQLNKIQIELSDIVSFHNYGTLPEIQAHVAELEKLGRPLLCTEYMARSRGSLFKTHLPFFKEKKIACYNWGLVNGRTQTHQPWGTKPGGPEPETWFHDIFRGDGSPYDVGEVKFIRSVTR